MEEWRPVPGFEGRFLVSNFGNARTLSKVRRSENGNMMLRVKGSGYVCVRVMIGGKKVEVRLHRWVCLAFNGSPEGDKIYVNHKDGNKLNNTPENLEWVTKEENNTHAIKTGLNPCLLTDEQVLDILKRRKSGERTGEIKSLYGLNDKRFYEIVNRKTYKWVVSP